MTPTEAARSIDDPDGEGDDDQPDDEHLGRVARWVGSDASVVWAKRIVMGLALAFLVGALGYFIGVRTMATPSNEVDAGFLRDMTDHHDQAVRMAQIELANGSDPVVKGFAMEVLLFQRHELGRMRNFKDQLGATDPEYRPDRTTMEWMGMPTPLERMPGMASEEQLDELDALKGEAADERFLQLMSDHHLGGVHMAEYEAMYGANPELRDMADRLARNQRIEVKEYQGVADRLAKAG